MSDSKQDEKAANPSTLPKELGHIPIGHPDSSMSVESVRRAVEEFIVRPSDIICATFPKTGTTLVTWLCHQIRTGGDVGFDTMYRVVPWPLISWDFGYDPNVDGSEYSPRVFKSHLRLASVYRGCKYVVTVRHPQTTTLSFYNFLLSKKAPPVVDAGTVTKFLTDTPFVKGREGRASLWEMYKEYYVCRDCPNVLILVYEEMIKDLPSTVRLLAKFMNVDITEDTVQKVAKMSTKEFMAPYMDKFEEPYERAKKLGRVADLSHCAPADKVVLKRHEQELEEEGKLFLKSHWEKVMKPLGFENYEGFANMIREKNSKRFQ